MESQRDEITKKVEEAKARNKDLEEQRLIRQAELDRRREEMILKRQQAKMDAMRKAEEDRIRLEQEELKARRDE